LNSADTKKELADNLVTSLEEEIERLRRQSETIRLRRTLVSKDQKHKEAEDNEFREYVEENDGKLIYLDDYRMQAIKNRPQTFDLENISYEDLENLKEQHKAKLEELKSCYLDSKERGDKKGESNLEGITYEQLIAIRVIYNDTFRKNMKLE